MYSARLISKPTDSQPHKSQEAVLRREKVRKQLGGGLYKRKGGVGISSRLIRKDGEGM